jgi:tetratricopeptide (TPR) repeat protein
MARNVKRRARVLLILGVAGSLAAFVGGAYLWKQRKADHVALDHRERGRAALARGDYGAALDGLGSYLIRFGEKGATGEDWFLYGKARRRVEAPNGRHLGQAIAVLRKALEMLPASRDVQEELLALYVSTGYTTEALDLADAMLAGTPDDARLLATKRDLLVRLRRFAPALDVSTHLNRIRPDDVAGFLSTLELHSVVGTSRTQVDAWIDGVVAARAGDVRFELLRASAFLDRGETDRAREGLDRIVAASAAMDDVAFLSLLSKELDRARRFKDALTVLERVRDTTDPVVRRDYVRRLWFEGRMRDVADRTAPWVVDLRDADPELLALRAVVLRANAGDAEADALRRELAGRTDAVGRAWRAFVDHAVRTISSSASNGATVSAEESSKAARADAVALAEAVRAVPDSAILLQALGEAKAALGEFDAAFQSWEVAAHLAPAWPRPLTSIVARLRATGRTAISRPIAKEAYERAPGNLEALVTWLTTCAEDELPRETVANLVRSAESLQAAAPQAADAILPVQVGMLVKIDRAKAEERLLAVLAKPDDLGEATLLRLARMSDEAGMEFGPRLLEASQRIHGVTPRLALASALARTRSGDSASALRRFDEMRTGAPDGGGGLDWGLARAGLLDALGDTSAGEAWIALADGNPAVLQAQLGALASESSWRDLDAVERIVGRVRELTGEPGITWRTANARLTLSRPDATKSDLAEALRTLETVVRDAPANIGARVLLAQALERTGNALGADAQLQAALATSPDNAWIALELARLAQQRGDETAARGYLDRVASARDVAPRHVERAAFYLAAQGDLQRSRDLLLPLESQARANREGTYLLARLQARLGEPERALRLCEKLLDQPTLAVLELAAELHATLGRPEDAEADLRRIDALELRSGDRELARARHAARFGAPEAASRAFLAAVSAAPDRADAWTAAVSWAIGTADLPGLRALIDDPRGDGVESVRFLRTARDLTPGALADERLRPLLLAAAQEPTQRDVLLESIRLAVAQRSSGAGLEATAQRVRVLADANIRVLPLQMLAADLCVRVGDLRAATEIARRAAAEFPNSPSASAQWAETLARSERWPEALEAGLQWRDRADRQDLRPRLFVASALLRLGRPADATESLEPLASVALARPEANEQVLVAWVVSLARSGRIARASEVMGDLARRSERWKTIPLSVGAEWMGDAAGAVAWLRACSANVPSGDSVARLALARAWGAAWERYRTPELLAGARDVLAPLTAMPDSPADAHFFDAVLAQSAGDPARARASYLAALQRDPKHIPSRNNLAMVLADGGEWEEAVRHAEQVVQLAPRTAEFLDTLAYCLRKGRKFDDARSRLQEAIDLEPGNPAWRIGLAETQSEAGDVEALRGALARIDQLMASGTTLTPDLRRRLDAIPRPKR